MTGRGDGQRADKGVSRIGRRALEAEKARLSRHLQSINKHRQALELAIKEGFEEGFDAASWQRAFESQDPHDANRTMVITGDHSAVLNSYVEVLRAAAGNRLIGLVPYRRPRADQVFEAIRKDGGLSESQADLLNELYVLEGRIEHASPDVAADEVFAAIEQLRKELPSLVEAALGWLRRHGVELTTPRGMSA